MTDPRTPAEDDPQARALLRSVRRMEQLYAEFHGQAMARALAMLGDRQLAEDAVHQAFVQIIVPVFAGRTEIIEEDPRGAVLRSTRWAALNILRRRRRRRETEQVAGMLASGGDEAWVRVEARVLCESMLAELPEHYRAVLHCRYVEQDSDRAGAARLGITVKAYQRRLQRAVAAAQRALPPGAASLGALLQTLVRRRSRGGVRRRPLRGCPPLWQLAARRVAAALAISGGLAVPGTLLAPPSAVPAVVPAAAVSKSGAAWSETPEDTLLYSATVAPASARNHTVVAVGLGNRCRCPVLLRTSDSGATWQSAPGPEGATRVALPPAYPADPRIFVSGGATADIVSPGFGAPFGPIGELRSGGLAALDPGFDAGRPRMWLAGGDRMLRVVDVPTGASRRAWTSQQPFTAVLATAGGGAVAATAPQRGGGPSLVACTAALRCATHPLPGSSAVLTLLAAGGDAILVARRDGVSLLANAAAMPRQIALPAGVEEVVSATLVTAGTPTLWVVVGTAHGSEVLRLNGWADPWHAAGPAVAPRSAAVAISPRQALLLPSGRGIRCTADGGATWRPRCSS